MIQNHEHTDKAKAELNLINLINNEIYNHEEISCIAIIN